MALSLPRLTQNILSALGAGGAIPPNPAAIAMAAGLASAIIAELTAADVVPTGLPVPLTAPPSGGLVTGTGKIQ